MNNNLQILIEAVDNASSTIKGVADQLENMGGASQEAAKTVDTSMSDIGASIAKAGVGVTAIGTGILAPIYEMVKAAADSQAVTETLNTTISASVDMVNAAAKGQGSLADEIEYATRQANLAKDSLNKMNAANADVGTVSSSTKNKLVDLNNTLMDEQTKLGILKAEHVKAGTAAQSHALQITTLQQSIQKTTTSIAELNGKVNDSSTTIKYNADQIDQAQLKYDLAADKLSILKARMSDAGKSAADISAAFQPAIDAGIKLGFTAEETGKALNILEPIMGSKLSEQTIQAAEGLARMSNGTLDLTSAAKLLGVAMETGVGKGLAPYGIVIKDGLGPTQLLGAAMDATKGQAEGFAQTLSGKLAIAWATVNETQDAAGMTLTDVLGKIIDAITKVVVWVDNFIAHHQTLVKNVLIGAAVFGGLLVVFGTIAIAVGSLIALFTVGLPVAIGILVAGAIAALGAAAALVIANWTAVKNFFMKMWDDIKLAWSVAINWIEGILDSLTQKIQAVGSAIANSAIGKAISTVGGAVGGVVSSAIGGVSSLLHLATGGIVTQPTLALIGEAGPEAVVPLSGSSGGSPGGAGAINISIGNLYGTDQSAARDFANMIAKMLNQQLKLKTY